MTTIFLIVFAVVFYQLLIKTAFLPTTPNAGQHQTQERLNLDDMWRAFQQRQTGRPNAAQAQPEKKQSRFSKSKGYQGGEYIDYEEIS